MGHSWQQCSCIVRSNQGETEKQERHNEDKGTGKKPLKNYTQGHFRPLFPCVCHTFTPPRTISRRNQFSIMMSPPYTTDTAFQKYSRQIAECAVETGVLCLNTSVLEPRKTWANHSSQIIWKNTSQEGLHLFQPWFALQLDEPLYHSPERETETGVLSLGLDTTGG